MKLQKFFIIHFVAAVESSRRVSEIFAWMSRTCRAGRKRGAGAPHTTESQRSTQRTRWMQSAHSMASFSALHSPSPQAVPKDQLKNVQRPKIRSSSSSSRRTRLEPEPKAEPETETEAKAQTATAAAAAVKIWKQAFRLIRRRRRTLPLQRGLGGGEWGRHCGRGQSCGRNVAKKKKNKTWQRRGF